MAPERDQPGASESAEPTREAQQKERTVTHPNEPRRQRFHHGLQIGSAERLLLSVRST